MEKLTAQQASDLGKTFLALAQSIGDFRYKNWNDPQNQQLGNFQWSILNSAEDIFALSATLVMDDVQRDLAKIKDVTNKINESLKTLRNIQKGIDIAAAVVTLGAAIISKSPQGIVDALNGLFKTVISGN